MIESGGGTQQARERHYGLNWLIVSACRMIWMVFVLRDGDRGLVGKALAREDIPMTLARDGWDGRYRQE